MSRLRMLQALAAVVLIIGIGVGLSRVQWTSGDHPLVRWLPGEPAVTPPPEPQPKPQAEKPAAPEAPEPMQCYVIKGPVRMALEAPPPQPKPEPPPRDWAPAGSQTITAIAQLLNDEVESSAGYEANDLVIGKLFENLSNEQRGENEAILEYLNLTLPLLKPASPAMAAVRENLLQADLEKWWMPSAESSLKKGVAGLTALASEMKNGSPQLPGDPVTLKKILHLIKADLDRQQQSLIADEIPWSEVDDRFYHGRGAVRASFALIEALMADYPEPIAEKAVALELNESQRWLGQAAAMDPTLVLGGDLDEFTSNHLVLMAYTLDKASQALDRALTKLGD